MHQEHYLIPRYEVKGRVPRHFFAAGPRPEGTGRATDGILSYVDVVPGRTTDLGRRLYDSVFLPEFGADELSPPWFDEPDGVFTIAAVDAGGEPVGGISTWEYNCGVLLIGYIAVRPEWRRHRVAETLVDVARDRWWGPHQGTGPAPNEGRGVSLVVLEVEDPRYFDGPSTWGRVAFFDRVGARVLAIDGRLFPYTQPKLASSAVTRHVQHMLLGVLPLSTEREQEPDPTLIVEWLREYYAQEEGTSSLTDGNEPPGIDMLLDAERVETVPFGEFANLPQVGEH